MKRTSIVLALAAVAVFSSACGKSEQRALSAAEAADLLINRNWLDRMPEDRDQRIHVYRFTPAMGGGVFQDRTLFAGRFELFTFGVEGDHLKIDWPDRDLHESIPFHIEKVDGPKPFDLRLRLEGNAVGPRVYYGMSREGRELASELAFP